MNNNKPAISHLAFLRKWLTITTLIAGNCYIYGASANDGLQSLSNQVGGTSIVVDGSRE